MTKRLSAETVARRRNANAAKRAPLFAHAGLLEEWSAQAVKDDDVARALELHTKRMETWIEYVKLRDAMIDCLVANDATIPNMTRETTSTEYVLERLSRACAPYFNRLPYEHFKVFYGYDEAWSVKLERYAQALTQDVDELQLSQFRKECLV